MGKVRVQHVAGGRLSVSVGDWWRAGAWASRRGGAMGGLADDRRTYHPLFRRRNFALRALEKKLGRRLDIQEVMDLFGVNENVARQTRGARWEAEQEANGDADLE